MRVFIFVTSILIVGFAPLGVLADGANTVTEGLFDCVKVSSDEKRLICFDQLARKTLVPLSSTKVSNAVKKQQEYVKLEETKKVDDFSKEALKKSSEEKGPESITATVSKLKKMIRGQWIIYFENGQKWQQKDSAKIMLSVGDVVRLKKGSMGSVFLLKEGSNRNVRVKRLK